MSGKEKISYNKSNTTNNSKDINDNNENNPFSDINTEDENSNVNCHFCDIKAGILFTYIFIACSITISIINRVIFYQYEFEFNFFIIFLQQMFHLAFYIIASWKSELFNKEAGDISFQDFYNMPMIYFGYSIFFIFKNFFAFLGYQIVRNIPMYVNLRRLVTVMSFLYNYFFKTRRISSVNILVVFLLTIGAILSGIDDYKNDIIGIIIVFCENILSLINLEISENFRKIHGISNIKLLAYNSFILPPILLILMFIFGEFKDIKNYFNTEHDFSYYGLFINLLISCSIICINNLSFFVSNEKNTSLFTQLLSDVKYIFISILSYFILKTFSFTIKNILGLFISTLGAMIITISTMYENIDFNRNKKDIIDPRKFIEMSNSYNNNTFFSNDKLMNSNIDINFDSKFDSNETDFSTIKNNLRGILNNSNIIENSISVHDSIKNDDICSNTNSLKKPQTHEKLFKRFII